MNNIRSTLAIVWRIASPYFRSEDRLAGRLLLAAVIAIELSLVGIDVLINQWQNRFFNALQERNWGSFISELGVFSILAFAAIGLAVYQLYLNQWLQIRWRRWMTTTYLSQWLHNANHYRMELNGDTADNPDQRITDDVKIFVERTLNIGVGLLSSVVTLVSFVVILWGLSEAAPLTIFGSEFAIPGYLVWGALIYAVFGTVLTQWIGSPLVQLDFQQQRFEADFRFNLVRVRENSEQIALLRGENAERERLSARFGRVVANWYGIMTRTKRLTAFTTSYTQAAIIFPYILVAPAYFANKIQLGGLQQTASAFDSVRKALSFFVEIYRALAEWQAVVARLDGFEQAIERATAIATGPGSIDIKTSTGSDHIDLDQLLLRLPEGTPLVAADGFSLRSNERTLVTGPSGSGKSTLFRAIAGIWPFGSGSISIPAKATLMMLPQRPYFPVEHAAGCHCLPGEIRRVHAGPDQGRSRRGRPAAVRAAARGGGTLEPDAVARRAAAARAGARAVAQAAISVPRRGDRLARRTFGSRALPAHHATVAGDHGGLDRSPLDAEGVPPAPCRGGPRRRPVRASRPSVESAS